MIPKSLSGLAVLCILLAFCCSLSAQTNPNLDEIGLKPYGSFEGGKIDTVSMVNGNLSIHIPLFSYPQRGSLPGDYFMKYNGKNWWVYQHCNLGVCTDQWKWSYHDSGGVLVVHDDLPVVTFQTLPGSPTLYLYTANASDGSAHTMLPDNAGGYRTVDGSGIWNNGWNGANGLPGPVTIDREGNKYTGPTTSASQFEEDANGNKYTWSSNVLSDTLARVQGSETFTSDYSGCVQPAAPAQISSAYIDTYPGQNGVYRQIKRCLASYSLRTNFQATDWEGNPIQEGSSTQSFNVSVVLYNGSSWSSSPSWGFDYDTYGDLSKITLPTGGTISYGWSPMTTCTATTALTQESLAVSSRTLNANDGTGAQQWTYSYGVFLGTQNGLNTFGTVVTDPSGNQRSHWLQEFGNCGNYETQTQWFQGSRTAGTLLKTEITDYIHSSNPYVSRLDPAPNISVFPIRVTTTLPGGLTSKIEKDYDTAFKFGSISYSYGEVLATREYDFGTNAPGPLVRTTTNAYLPLTNNSYLAANLFDLVSSSIMTNSSGTQISKKTFTYDGSTLQSSGITTQRDTSIPNPGVRGNLTSSCRWLNTSGGNICGTTKFFDTGRPYQVTDPLNNTTTFTYSSTYAGAYLTQTNLPDTGSPAIHHIVSGTYDFNTSALLSVTDQNSKTTNYTYDPLGRVLTGAFPYDGQTTFAYTDTALSARVEKTQTISTSPAVSTDYFAYFDGLARKKQTKLASDPSGSTYVDITYDGLSRAATVSNPYRSTSDPTYGITTTQFDALDRVTKLIPPDGTTSSNNVTTTYDIVLSSTPPANCTTVTDQAGKSRKSCTDGLGRLTQVFEDPAGLNYETDYTYDVLNNLLTVNQKGGSTNSANWRTRTFTYNSLSQLLTASNPESGTITYTYDNNGNLATKVAPAPNQTGSTTVTTTYSYDALNRLTQKTYSDGATPTLYYRYDMSMPWGSPYGGSYVGRLSQEDAVDASGHYVASHIFVYDVMGRIQETGQCPAATCSTSLPGFHTIFTHDLTGNLTSYYTAENGITFGYQYDSASRPIAVTNSYVDPQHPATLATVNLYTPSGYPEYTTYGNGTVEVRELNTRLQPCRFNVNTGPNPPSSVPQHCGDNLNQSGTSLQDFYLTYNEGTANNGNVAMWQGTFGQTFHRYFSYDSLNRVSSMSEGFTNPACKGLTWTYDAWGNRTDQTVTSGTCNTFHSGVGTNNRLVSPYQYDAAGNMTYDGSHYYTYDAENHLTKVDGGSTATYAYDAEGNRVQKTAGSVITLYVFNPAGQVIHETDANLNFNVHYIHLGSRLLAEMKNSTTYFVQNDHLGSARLLTAMNQSVYDSMDYLPFGEQIAGSSGTSHKFTGKERDSESGLDEFGARYYSSTIGRFTIPDWATNAVDVPYADFGNPQSLNLYSYVKNNPVTLGDPDGHCCDPLTIAADIVRAVVDFKNAQDSFNHNYATDPAFRKIADREIQNALTNATIVGTTLTLEVSMSNGANETNSPSSESSVSETQTIRPAAQNAAEPEIADEAVIARGGTKQIPDGTFSAGVGSTETAAGAGVKNNQIQTSTAGAIRGTGGTVEYKPEPAYPGGPTNYRHVNVTGGQKTFSPPKPNPAPKDVRPPNDPNKPN